MHKNSMNKVILVGRLGRDPESRATQAGLAIANFSVATSEIISDQTGNTKELTEWHRCVAFGKTAEFVNNYVRKGRLVYIEGKLRTRKWQDKDGAEKYTTEVNVDMIMALDKREDTGNYDHQDYDNNGDYYSNPGASTRPTGSHNAGNDAPPPMDEELPF